MFWMKVKIKNEFYKTLNKYLIVGTRSRIQSRLYTMWSTLSRPHVVDWRTETLPRLEIEWNSLRIVYVFARARSPVWTEQVYAIAMNK